MNLDWRGLSPTVGENLKMNYSFSINKLWSTIEEVRNPGTLVMGKHNSNFQKTELKIWGYRPFEFAVKSMNIHAHTMLSTGSAVSSTLRSPSR